MGTEKKYFVPLEIAKGLYFHVSRIGYPEEGIRLTFLDDVPFRLHFEVQLSRKDTEQVIAALTDELNSKTSKNSKR